MILLDFLVMCCIKGGVIDVVDDIFWCILVLEFVMKFIRMVRNSKFMVFEKYK